MCAQLYVTCGKKSCGLSRKSSSFVGFLGAEGISELACAGVSDKLLQ